MKRTIRRRLVWLASCGLSAAPLLAHGPHRHPEATQASQDPVAREEAEVLTVLTLYRAAMEARSVEKLAELVAPELLVLEGVYKNVGWADYRDNHIGPEMKGWTEFKALDPKVIELAVHGELAYAVQESTVIIVEAGKAVTLAGAETFVLRKGLAGWRIKHLHFSGKKKEPAAAKP